MYAYLVLSLFVRHSLHQGGSLQNGLGDEQTCGTTLASAYVLWQPLDQCPIEAQVVNLTGEISSGEHELCNSQENLIGNHNSILPTIYISVLGPCYNFSTPTLMSIHCPHVHYSSTMHLSQGYHAMSMCPDIILFNLHYTCMHHVYTMRNPCSLILLHL